MTSPSSDGDRNRLSSVSSFDSKTSSENAPDSPSLTPTTLSPDSVDSLEDSRGPFSDFSPFSFSDRDEDSPATPQSASGMLPLTDEDWLSTVLVGTRSSTLLVADCRTGQLLTRIPTEQTVVRVKNLPLVEDPDDPELRVWTCECSWGGNRGVTEISLSRFCVSRHFPSHTGVNDFSAAVVRQKGLIVTACDDHYLHVHVAATGKRLTSLGGGGWRYRRHANASTSSHRWRHPGQIAVVLCLPLSTSQVYSGDTSGTLCCWDLEKGGSETNLVDHTRLRDGSIYIAELRWVPSLQVVATGTNAGALQLWDVRKRNLVSCCEVATSQISSLELLSDYVLISAGRTTVGVHDLRMAGRSKETPVITASSFEVDSSSRLGIAACDERHFVVADANGREHSARKFCVDGPGSKPKLRWSLVLEESPLGVGCLGYNAANRDGCALATDARLSLEDELERIVLVISVWMERDRDTGDIQGLIAGCSSGISRITLRRRVLAVPSLLL